MLMVSVSEVWKTWNEGFASKDPSQLAELLTDNFRFVSVNRDISKKEALDWTAEDCLQMGWIIWKFSKNNDVAVICHSANALRGMA